MVIDVGSEVGGVHINELAARSPASEVYRGTDVATGSIAAVKVLRDCDPAATRRLRREAALLSDIDHPGVVGFRGFHDVDDQTVLITEWVDGVPLLERIRSAELSTPDQALELLGALAISLDFLHGQQIVHRDISPANIIMQPSGLPVLVDLGIGHAVGQATMTSHDLVAGTPKYLAPEVIRGEAASAQSDQYSLAVVLHELLTGQSPFPTSTELATALHHHMHTSPEPLDEIDPTIPTPLAAAVGRAMSKDPDDRFATVAAFADAASAETAPPARRVRPTRRWLAVTAAVLATTILAATFWPERTDQELAASEPVADTGPNTDTVNEPEPEPEPEPVNDTVIEPESGPDADAATVTNPAWPAGHAEQLACNLLTGAVFENGSVPLDYYGDPPGRERVVASGGYSDSWALEIGLADNYGQYGEVISISPGESYVFGGWFREVGPVAESELGITLLDANYQTLNLSVSAPITQTGDAQNGGSFVLTQFDTVPDQAAFAVPYLFKDSSPGVVLADELVFGTRETCDPEFVEVIGP